MSATQVPMVQPNYTRRTALRTGAVIGTVAWVAPLLQVIDMSAANADYTSVPPKKVELELPSHGFAIFSCGPGLPFVVKIEGATSPTLSGINNSGPDTQDQAYLSDQHNLLEGRDYRQPTATDLAEFGFGDGDPSNDLFGITMFSPPSSDTTYRAYFLTVPAKCTVVSTYVYVRDGSFQNLAAGDQDKYTRAFRAGTMLFFTKALNDITAKPGE